MSRHQLYELGCTRGSIARRVEKRRLHRIHRGVYAVGHRRLTAQGRWMAAVLACGPGAVLSHHQAAAHHHLRQIGGGPIHVTAPVRHSIAGIRCHRARALDRAEVTTIDGIPVTTLARTYLDLAEVLSLGRLIDALEAGQRQNKLDVGALHAVIGRARGRHGSPRLRAALAEIADEAPLLQSELERVFRHLVRAHDLPAPQFNVYVEGELCDAVWAQYMLVVEIDGRGFHTGRRQFEADRRRDRRLVRAGWRVVRFTYQDVTERPGEVAAELSELLGRGGPWPRPVR